MALNFADFLAALQFGQTSNHNRQFKVVSPSKITFTYIHNSSFYVYAHESTLKRCGQMERAELILDSSLRIEAILSLIWGL